MNIRLLLHNVPVIINKNSVSGTVTLTGSACSSGVPAISKTLAYEIDPLHSMVLLPLKQGVAAWHQAVMQAR